MKKIKLSDTTFNSTERYRFPLQKSLFLLLKYKPEFLVKNVKSQVMRISRSTKSLQVKVGNIKQRTKEFDHLKYLGSVFIMRCYCTKEIKMRIVIPKEAFDRKMSLLTSKLKIELEKKLVRCYVWSIALYGSETWTLRKLERKYLDSFEMWCWRRMEKIKWKK